MKKYLTMLLSAALGLSACSSDKEQTRTGHGYVNFACDASTEVIVRAATPVDVPAGEEFALTISNGTDYEQSWTRLSDFVPADNILKVGKYTASVAWGDIQAEGINKPYYAGSTEFTIVSDKTVQTPITARLGNAQVKVVCTENFKGYFHDTAFTLTTAAGNTFPFTDSSEDTVFVRPDASFTLSGSAVKQNGSKIDLSAQTVASAKPQTLYTFTYDVSGAGSASITITLDDTIVEVIPIDAELNPNA